ncbi:hypothetical protein K1719_007987 [Acacia pycnantha]|nr:hypothetical protein K1719_007987 [Acacia pycnantha]
MKKGNLQLPDTVFSLKKFGLDSCHNHKLRLFCTGLLDSIPLHGSCTTLFSPNIPFDLDVAITPKRSIVPSIWALSQLFVKCQVGRLLHISSLSSNSNKSGHSQEVHGC